jgi:SAM-dependent methyltransferase
MTAEPASTSAAPAPLRTTTDALDRAAAFARHYCRALPATPELDEEQAHAVFADFLLRDFPAVVRQARETGLSDHDLATVLIPLADVVSASALIRRAQQQPRGHAGDFEIIEYLLARRSDNEPGTWGRMFEDFLLHSDAAQQHHNKIAHQAALIEACLAGGPSRPARSILLIASGAAADLRRIDPTLLQPGDRIVLNDIDPDALTRALAELPAATAARTTTVPGNALRKSAELAADAGPFDLVLAGGLFDYLDQRPAQVLVRAVLNRLCRPGGTFYFSNIATGNPFATAMKYGANWPLIEREEADIEAVVHAAAPAEVQTTTIRRDATGLTLLAEIKRVRHNDG